MWFNEEEKKKGLEKLYRDEKNLPDDAVLPPDFNHDEYWQYRIKAYKWGQYLLETGLDSEEEMPETWDEKKYEEEKNKKWNDYWKRRKENPTPEERAEDEDLARQRKEWME